MPRFSFRAVAVVGLVLFPLLAPSSSWAGGPGKWTKLATIDNSFDTFGIARTAGGKLHLAWLAKKASNNTYSYGTSTISLAGKLLATGTALSGWHTLNPDPRLVKDGSGLRLVFGGGTGSSGCYISGAVFTATSTNGSTWSLSSGSMSHSTVGTSNLAATTESDGTTPVALFAGGHLFHVGADPTCPATAPDGTITPTSGSSQNNPAVVTDAHDGSVWAAWFQGFQKQAYWVERILPTQGAPMEAPSSATHITPFQNNQPDEPVALAARVGGGVYMAYCVASSSQPCAHIDLWKVGASAARVVPGSNNTTGARVTLAAGPGGRLAVAWYNEAKNVIHSVRTNTTATSFGVVRTIKTPPHTTGFNDIQAEDSTGRMDVLINAQIQTGPSTYPLELFQTQILPGLSLRANPSSFSHTKAATVTFTVADAGQPVAGAKVSCIGKSGTTASTGQVKLHFSKGTAVGNHVCTATKGGYNAGLTTVKVT